LSGLGFLKKKKNLRALFACSLRGIMNDPYSFWILRTDHWSKLYVACWVIIASSSLESFI